MSDGRYPEVMTELHLPDPARLVQLQKVVAPFGSRYNGRPIQGDHVRDSSQISGIHTSSSTSSPQITTHRTGLPIAALDINKDATHAVLAGTDILQIIRLQDGKTTEELNIRAALGAYASTHSSPQMGAETQRREYLPARDVRWSTGDFKHIIATAANNGRISLYDVNSPRIELRRFHEHANQINKLDFDPFAGYYLLSASQDKSVRLWDVRAGKPDRSHSRFEPRIPVRDVKWSPVELFDFAVCTDSGVIQLWDARSPLGPKLSINAHEKACYAIDWHPDGRHIISGGFDRYIRVWDFQLDNKRQKSVFQFRAPCAIRNIKWRPACRASESTDSGYWQSTQVAVTYHKDDPRIHVWDLRRPWLPFRELDRYNLPVNDLVWANKDRLWTVGDEGYFTQWDLQRSSPFYNELPPSTSTFMPDGQCYLFSEEREIRRGSGLDDPALGFLSIPQDKLSSGDDPSASRSLTDDEAIVDIASNSAHRRYERGGLSSRSAKSQANSPPSVDDRPPVLALDKAVFQHQDLYNNKQVGAVSNIPGITTDSDVIEFLATNYASPAFADERIQSPELILERLSAAFHQNADTCDAVSMHRTAQTWRILESVIIPELKDWADGNRNKRRADAARRRDTLESFRSGSHRSAMSPLAGLPTRTPNPKETSKAYNLRSNLFKSKLEAEHSTGNSEAESTSNMTTPLAKPIPISSPSGRKRYSQLSIDEGIDDLALLPPSVLSSHTTAAAAARALVDSPDRVKNQEQSSPEYPKSPRKNTRHSANSPVQQIKSPKPLSSGQTQYEKVNDIATDKGLLSPRVPDQEDRRAALRDYRVQARPIFSLEEAAKHPGIQSRHDSGESFQMFSASIDGSQKTRSLGQSFESPDLGKEKVAQQKSGAFDSDDEAHAGLSFEESRQKQQGRPFQRAKYTAQDQKGLVSASDTTLDMSLGNESSIDSKKRFPFGKTNAALTAELGSTTSSELNTALSSPHEIFEFEELSSIPKSRIHISNPLRGTKNQNVPFEEGYRPTHPTTSISMDELDHPTYLHQDFRPIDLFKYEPKSPFAWSSLPLVCQSIAFDMENGIGHGHFSVHLLMHLHPYFFHPCFREVKFVDTQHGGSLADRLMIPHLGHRIIEAIFENHLSFLRQTGLVESAATLRKLCVEFEYPRLYSAPEGEKPTGSTLSGGDAYSLSIVCSYCHAPMSQEQNVCDRCQNVRPPCPVCLSSTKGDLDLASPSGNSHDWYASPGLSAFCQACGHSGHIGCLNEWFSQPASEGTCPTRGCGCDCGPGKTRLQRIKQQIKREEETRLIRGGSNDSGSTRRDSLRAGVSPAVDKARAALRTGIIGDRGTQSGDERNFSNRRGSGRGRISGFNNSRKSVRLVTPGEESGPGESHS